ncbi:MAG: hypothetical protein HFJ55_03925 [Clostridia bacterium]|nr:hypothetical protein [Clostridia bacterium]
MKKALTISLLVVMLVVASATLVNAATSVSLGNDLYTIGAKYGMTSADKVKVDRYLATNPITDAQADAVLAKANEAVAVMEKAGVTNFKDLTEAQKAEVKSIATAAASIIDVKLVFNSNSVKIYDNNGKLIETVSNNDGKLAYTGNNMNVVLVISVIAIIALAITIVAKRTFADAK